MNLLNPLATDLEHVLDHTSWLWKDMRGQRIFITGGTGFFGMWLLESFAWANRRLDLKAEAVVLSRDPLRFSRKAPHLCNDRSIWLRRGDVREFAFPDGAFQFVIHAATPADVDLNRNDPLTMLDIIVAGTRRALGFASQRGARKFLLVSSGAIYGQQPRDLAAIPEEHCGGPETMHPASAYAEGKRIAELLTAIYAEQAGIEATIARCFSFIGPHLPLNKHYAAGNFIRDAVAGGPIVVHQGSSFRSYLYAADLAIWIWTILFRGESCRPYNVGSDERLSIDDLAETVSQLSGAAVTSNQAKSHPSASAATFVPDISRAKTELGLSVWIGLSEAIRRTVVFAKTNHAAQEPSI